MISRPKLREALTAEDAGWHKNLAVEALPSKVSFPNKNTEHGGLEQFFFFLGSLIYKGPNVFHFEGFLGPINNAPEGSEIF